MGLLLIGLGIGVAAQQNQAQQSATGLNIEISPAKLLLEGAPGKTLDLTIRIRNRNQGVEELKFEIFKVVNKNDKIELIAPDTNDEFVSWVNFGKEQPLQAPYDQFITMPITINLPSTAAFAYNYAVLISKAETPKAEPGQTQAIEGKIAQFILLDVIAPGAKRSAELIEFKTDRKWYSFLPVELFTTIKSTGNLNVTPVGNIFIKNMSGNQIATLDLNTERGTIIPSMTRVYQNIWLDGFPSYKEVDGKRKLVWDWHEINKFRFGKYRAEAVVVYNDGNRDVPLAAAAVFWIIPWWLLLIALAILIAVIYGLHRILRSIWRRLKGSKRKSHNK